MQKRRILKACHLAICSIASNHCNLPRTIYCQKLTMAANNTVILGGGIIGVSTAYFLSQSPEIPASSIHIVEAAPELFASASGFAAGFCAKDWYSSSVAPLGELSFNLHKKLAHENNGKENWGYSRSTGTSFAEGPRRGERGDEWLNEGASRADVAGQHEFKGGKGPAWLTRGSGDSVDIISEDDSTAQVCVWSNLDILIAL